MFTLKFYKQNKDDDTSTCEVFSTHRYSIYDRNNGSYAVSIFIQKLPAKDTLIHNLDVEVSKYAYTSCYIENLEGMLVDKIELQFSE